MKIKRQSYNVVANWIWNKIESGADNIPTIFKYPILQKKKKRKRMLYCQEYKRQNIINDTQHICE